MKRITIIGGGIGGLALGIALRQREVPVTLWEAGNYPRHRVCGEFLSGDGQRVLRELGLLEKCQAAGAGMARTVRLYSGRQSSPALSLTEPAWTLSRFAFDEILAREFMALGGQLRAGERFVSVRDEEGMVFATGRRVQTVRDGWRWIGLKAHATGIPLAEDLELHFTEDGYVGLNRLSSGIVNICGLVRTRGTLPGLARDWPQYLSGAAGSVLHDRLRQARFEEKTFASVAGLFFEPFYGSRCRTTLSVGDAMSAIAPLTGNGMSVALESGALAVGVLTRYSRSEVQWSEVLSQSWTSYYLKFYKRLQRSSYLQRVVLDPRWHPLIRMLMVRSGWPFKFLFKLTR